MLAGAGKDTYIIPVYADSDSAGHLQLEIIIVFLAEILPEFQTKPKHEA
jgi:hypothetical protein